MTRGGGATRVLGVATVAMLALTALLALVVSPPEVNQGDSVRLLYLHVPTAWLALYLSFGVTSLASALYLWPRTRSRFWDMLAGASAEIGVLFLALTLAIGSIWGRPTWGVWWTWDARLTTTAVLLVLYLGYLAVRTVPGDPEVTAKRAAVVALAAFVDVPLIHQSVEWWRSQHQAASVLDDSRLLDPRITGTMGTTLLVSVLAFTLLYAWLLVHRVRLADLDRRAGGEDLARAMAERHAEGTDPVPTGLVSTEPQATGLVPTGLVPTEPQPAGSEPLASPSSSVTR